MNHLTYPLSFAYISIFLYKSETFFFKRYRYRMYFNTKFLVLLTFFRAFKGFFNKCYYNFDDANKIGHYRSS